MNMHKLRATALAPLVLLLSGCMSMSLDTTINNDNDITFSMTMGIDNTYMSDLGVGDLCSYITENGGTSSLGLPGNVSMTPGSSNNQSTCQMTASGLTLSDFNSSGFNTSGDALTHANGEYTFTMSMGGDSSDLSGYGVSSSDIASMISPFAISVTFPGPVVSSTPQGTVSGNTVTWSDPTLLLSSTPLVAVGKDAAPPAPTPTATQTAGDNSGTGTANSTSGSGGVSWVLIAGIAAGVIIIAAIAIIVVMAGNRKKAQATAATQAQFAQAGYGQPYPTPQYGQPAAPQYATPAPPQYAAPAAPMYAQPGPQQPVQTASPQYAAPAPTPYAPPQQANYPVACPNCGGANAVVQATAAPTGQVQNVAACPNCGYRWVV